MKFQAEKTAKRIGDTVISGDGAVVSASADSKNRLVGARDYATSKGYSGIVDWDGENVLVGGTAIKPERVTNGIAYVRENMLEDALGEFEDRNGIVGRNDIMKDYDKKYGGMISKALKSLTECDEFSYNPETDPVYNAYKTGYERLAEEAYRRVLNDNNTSVTGASGAVLAEAMESRDDFLRELADKIPELAENAYERYEGETKRLGDNLESIADIADAYYERMYESNRDTVKSITDAGAAERKEKQRWVDNERADEDNARKSVLSSLEMAQLAAELENYPQKTELANEKSRLANEGAALDNAAARGFFIAEDERSIPWLAGFRNGYGYSIEPHTALAALEYSKAYSRQRANINAKMGW